MRRIAVLAALSTILAVSCASTGGGLYQRGKASWYGKTFHGLPTASGEIFDMNAMTAAHRTLPLGTWVEVFCPSTGRRVTVKVNDRGPFVRGRILDLSYGAAKRLGIVNAGVAEVEIYVRQAGQIPPPAPQPEKDFPGLVVQVGAFKDAGNAEALADRLRRDFPTIHLESIQEFTRVLVGPYEDRDEAESAADRLRNRGYTPIIRKATSP